MVISRTKQVRMSHPSYFHISNTENLPLTSIPWLLLLKYPTSNENSDAICHFTPPNTELANRFLTL